MSESRKKTSQLSANELIHRIRIRLNICEDSDDTVEELIELIEEWENS